MKDSGLHARNISTVSTVDSGEYIEFLVIRKFWHYGQLIFLVFAFPCMKKWLMKVGTRSGRTVLKVGRIRKTRKRRRSLRFLKKFKFLQTNKWTKTSSKFPTFINTSKMFFERCSYLREAIVFLQARRAKCNANTFTNNPNSKEPNHTLQNCDYRPVDHFGTLFPLQNHKSG